MKNLFLGALAFLSFATACSTRQANQFSIYGTTDLPDGNLIKIRSIVSKDSIYTDSTYVSNGKFTFTGTVNVPNQALIYIGNTRMGNDTIRVIILEPTDYSIKFTGPDYSHSVVEGSEVTLQNDSLILIQEKAQEEMAQLRKELEIAQNDSVKIAEISRKARELGDKIQKIQIDFVKTHQSSILSPIILQRVKYFLSLDELKEIVDNWTSEVQNSDPSINEYITDLERIKPGSEAPEIAGKDQNGKDVSLSGLKGKVVLIDFWATWCGPCRAALPHVKEIYKRYHDKGLEVLCVSLDFNEEPWKKFIAESDMDLGNYHHVYERDCGWDSRDANNYVVKSIPAKFLIDRDGIIIGKFDSNEDLDAKLAEIFTE